MDSPEGFRSGITDERLAVIIGDLLRIGVFASAAIVSMGGLFYLIEHHADPVVYRDFQLERNNLRSASGILSSALRLRADAIIQFGLLVLVATPVARVVLALIGFTLERDRLYM